MNKNRCIALATELFFEEVKIKKMEFIGLDNIYGISLITTIFILVTSFVIISKNKAFMSYFCLNKFCT